MNAKISVFVIFVEEIIYLLLFNLHDCIFKEVQYIYTILHKQLEIKVTNFTRGRVLVNRCQEREGMVLFLKKRLVGFIGGIK